MSSSDKREATDVLLEKLTAISKRCKQERENKRELIKCMKEMMKEYDELREYCQVIREIMKSKEDLRTEVEDMKKQLIDKGNNVIKECEPIIKQMMEMLNEEEMKATSERTDIIGTTGELGIKTEQTRTDSEEHETYKQDNNKKPKTTDRTSPKGKDRQERKKTEK